MHRSHVALHTATHSHKHSRPYRLAVRGNQGREVVLLAEIQQGLLNANRRAVHERKHTAATGTAKRSSIQRHQHTTTDHNSSPAASERITAQHGEARHCEAVLGNTVGNAVGDPDTHLGAGRWVLDLVVQGLQVGTRREQLQGTTRKRQAVA